ncbi:hypothetical protein SY88_09465 [Clostridiales bacterium PH28_bin88]|nr:hypothetical protein SY88_09465 [Clostridiales bacterium PH28_bin88]
MRKRVLISRILSFMLSVLLLFTLVPAAFAEGETMTMEELYFSVWPEYDTPDVLVIYSGTFVNNTGKDFQGEIRYNMPKGAKVNMVCETEKGMVCQKYVVETSNPEYDQVVWKPSRVIKPGEKFPVMFEYNYNTFSAPGERKFTALFQPTFPVTDLSVEVKEPKNASGLRLSPASTATQQDGEGFNNYYYRYENVKPGDKIPFEVTYTRNETKPSVEKATGAGTAQPASTSGGSSLNSTVVILLVAFLAMLGIFMVYAMRSNQGGGSRNRSGNQKSRSHNRQVAAAQAETKNQRGKGSRSQAVQEEKKKIRKMLLDGKISEETYRQLLAELDEE